MGQTRWQRLVAVGLEGMSEDHKLVCTPMVRAIARMIDEATKPKEKRGRVPEAQNDWRIGNEVVNNLASWAPGTVAWEPVQARTLVALGRAYREGDLRGSDELMLANWLRDGGLSWMNEKPTTSYVARNLVDLVAKARAAQPKQDSSALDRVRR